MNYSTSVMVEQTPAQVFAAVTNVRGWWSEEIEGGTSALNDEFTFRFKDLHVSTQRLTEVVVDERVVWRVLKARLSFAKDQREWEGTEVTFEITKRGRQTELKFTHVGLVPALECFNGCSSAWAFYVNESLKGLITAGKGQPNRAAT
jgi:hypothetical protein